MPKRDKPSKKSDRTPEEIAAKEARKVEKAAEKAAAKQAKRAEKEAKASAKAEKAAARKAAKDAAPSFKHVRKKQLTSGKGPTPKEIAESLVALFNAGKSEEAESTWYHRKIESIEEDGTAFDGWKGVLEKGKWWKENCTVISMRATAHFTCSTGFTVVYEGRVRMGDGPEADVRECGVYTVEDGRIVREQFMKG